jgi:nitroreductase
MTSLANQNAPEPIDVLDDLLSARFSCRAFLPKPVARATIERILAAAQKTASWCNSQPWRLEITSGQETQKFRELMYGVASSGRANSGDFPFPREYRGVYLERRRESGFQLYNSLGLARGDKAGYARQALENFNFFGAPHVAIVHTDEALGVYGAIDCGGYVTSFMLAAQALGVATIRKLRSRFIPRSCAGILGLARTGAWCAESRSAMPTPITRPTLIGPRVLGSPTP